MSRDINAAIVAGLLLGWVGVLWQASFVDQMILLAVTLAVAKTLWNRKW